ncbi:hypothetical protein V6N11_035369 [Hibiscus sabdariffa]|uniref:Uncharacterized protein n=1 Tax=Hibiscus sabdariffa TaxID=183260 RepID=A0ABR2R017_9ROSI
MAAAQSLTNPASTTSLISQSQKKSKPTSSSPFIMLLTLQSPWLRFNLYLRPQPPPHHCSAIVSFCLNTSQFLLFLH